MFNVFMQTNTFQALLVTDGWVSFAMFNFGNLSWTSGRLSGGDLWGRGGTAALVSDQGLKWKNISTGVGAVGVCLQI